MPRTEKSANVKMFFHTLRSAKEVIGYQVMSKENTAIGEVSDLVLDTTLWSLPFLRVRESVILRPRD